VDKSKHKQARFNNAIDHVMQLKIYVDGANPEVIRELKARIGEYHDYYGRLTEEQIWSLRSSNSWQVIPVNFQKRHREMLQWVVYVTIKKVHQDPSVVAATDSVTENCYGVRRLETR
jgi:hypothetical protein